MKRQATDNSFLEEKIELRLDAVNLLDANQIRVLNCFCGQNEIWRRVIASSDKDIVLLNIDKKKHRRNHISGDNSKITNINYDSFDIIDLDAYGTPDFLLFDILNKKYTGYVLVTSIKTAYGRPSKLICKQCGFNERFYEKSKSIFAPKDNSLLERFLASFGVKEITGYFLNEKSYFYFKSS
jgi:hypothetical protein